MQMIYNSTLPTYDSTSTPVTIYQSARRNTPKDMNLQVSVDSKQLYVNFVLVYITARAHCCRQQFWEELHTHGSSKAERACSV